MPNDPPASAEARLRAAEPTRLSELTILMIVSAAIVALAAVLAMVGLMPWPAAVAADRLAILKWTAAGVLTTLGLVVLIQLSSWVGSRVQFNLGPGGVSAGIEQQGGHGPPAGG